MKKISVIAKSDKMHSSLPMKPIGVSLHKWTPKGSLDENLKKALSLNQYWIDDCFLSPENFRIQLKREKRGSNVLRLLYPSPCFN